MSVLDVSRQGARLKSEDIYLDMTVLSINPPESEILRLL